MPIRISDTEGKDDYFTHIGNEYFIWFKSTPKKNRINFLKIFCVKQTDCIINSDAIEYMAVHGLPDYQLSKFMDIKGETFNDRKQWATFLSSIGVVSGHSCPDCHRRHPCREYRISWFQQRLSHY